MTDATPLRLPRSASSATGRDHYAKRLRDKKIVAQDVFRHRSGARSELHPEAAAPDMNGGNVNGASVASCQCTKTEEVKPDNSRSPAPADESLTRRSLLRYTAVLAFTAGFVNAAALLMLAFPVGNLTGVTTQLGMTTAHPWRYEEHMLVAILLGFFAGAFVAGALLGMPKSVTGTRHAVVLTSEAVLLLLAATGLEHSALRSFLSTIGVEQTTLPALFAAAALGLQNGLTSSIRQIAVRTTHFTGTVTDLGLMLGRARRHGLEKWKAAILLATLLLFLAGGATGLVTAVRFGGHALALPAAICLTVAGMQVARGRTLTTRDSSCI